MSYTYLSVEEVVEINKIVTTLSGGSHGLRDSGLLQSITLKPQTSHSGKELYPDIYLKAAVLFEAIVNYHVFIDGNKRTGFAALAVFLHQNGYDLTVKNAEIVTLCLQTANKELDLAEVATWVKAHCVSA